MTVWHPLFTYFAAPLLGLFVSTMAHAQEAQAQKSDEALEPLFEALRTAPTNEAEQIAEKIWQEWSKSGSASIDLLLNRGYAALDADNPEVATGHFSAVIDHAPDVAQGYAGRAIAYYSMQKFGPAMADIAKALAFEPRHFGALAGMARILEETDHPAQALAAWRQVERIIPNFAGLSEAVMRLRQEVEGHRI